MLFPDVRDEDEAITRQQPGGQDAVSNEPFYTDALAEWHRPALAQARRMHGLDEEIAMLRVLVRQAVEGGPSPDDTKAVNNAIRSLSQALVAQSRMRTVDEDIELVSEAVARVFEGLHEGIRDAPID